MADNDFKTRFVKQQKTRTGQAAQSSNPVESTFKEAAEEPSVRLTLKLPVSVNNQLKRIALDENTKVHPILVQAVENILEQYEKTGKLA